VTVAVTVWVTLSAHGPRQTPVTDDICRRPIPLPAEVAVRAQARDVQRAEAVVGLASGETDAF